MSEKPDTPHIPVHISLDNPEPLYAQIESQLRTFILAGVLKPGRRLPSVRALAAYVSCSLLTTKRAYDDLEREGLIRTRQGVGSVVADLSEEELMAHRRRPVAASMREAILAGRRSGFTEEDLREIFEEEMRSEEDDLYLGRSTR